MTRLLSAIVLFTTHYIVVSANKNGDSISDHVISASNIELKRIPNPSGDISTSDSIAREQRVLPEYRHDVSVDFDSVPKRSLLLSDPAISSNGILPEIKKPIPKKLGPSTSKPSGYGYPYRMAPTLPPFIKHLSDRLEDQSESKSAIIPPATISSRPKIPAMPHMPSIPKISAGDDDLAKHGDSLKKRQGLPFDDISSDSREFSPISFDYSSYKEPSYRNSHDLDFSPRKMYYESRGPYRRPAYSFPSLKPRLDVSPRDPYLSPSSEPIDGFYPKVKANAVSNSYSTYGKKDKYYNSIPDPVPPPSRAYDDDDDFSNPSSEEDDFHLGDGGYVKSEKYQERPSSYPDSYSEPTPKEPVREEGDSYDSLYNSPITGMTRQRLLEYAGASDLYNGEPDYLKSAAFRKSKYGSIQDDYHPYPRSRVYDFTDYHFDESRRIPTRVKRQVPQQELPNCSRNTSLPMCLTDADYPTDEVMKIVSKNIKFLSQLRNTRLEINQKKATNNAPVSFEDLKKTQNVCSSKKGYVYPKKAKDVDGIWRTVINIDGVKQSIEVDVCRSTETPCDYVPTVIPTKCVQKFAFITLITFNTKDNTLEHHDFPVPSSCACSVGRPTRVRFE